VAVGTPSTDLNVGHAHFAGNDAAIAVKLW
jgi:hypothetical protein